MPPGASEAPEVGYTRSSSQCTELVKIHVDLNDTGWFVALTTHHSLHEVDLDEISPARDGPETQLPTTWSIIIWSSTRRCRVFELPENTQKSIATIKIQHNWHRLEIPDERIASEYQDWQSEFTSFCIIEGFQSSHPTYISSGFRMTSCGHGSRIQPAPAG